jgi:hypothetical protein
LPFYPPPPPFSRELENGVPPQKNRGAPNPSPNPTHHPTQPITQPNPSPNPTSPPTSPLYIERP